MTDEANGGGRVVFTVKDLLNNIDKKLDALDVKLDTKADAQRLQDVFDYTTALERRTTLIEATMVRREGPFVTEMRGYERRVEQLENTLDSKIDTKIDASHARRFSGREKAALALFAGIGALGTIVSSTVLAYQLIAGG